MVIVCPVCKKSAKIRRDSASKACSPACREAMRRAAWAERAYILEALKVAADRGDDAEALRALITKAAARSLDLANWAVPRAYLDDVTEAA